MTQEPSFRRDDSPWSPEKEKSRQSKDMTGYRPFGNFDGKRVGMIEKKRMALAAMLALLLSAGVLGFFVYHHGRGTNPAGGEYQRTAENQQRITEGIQSAEETNAGIGDAIDRSTDRIAESQGTVQSARESIDRTEDDLDTAGRILEDCQRILSRVRERKQ